jgi:hypothetical protein
VQYQLISKIYNQKYRKFRIPFDSLEGNERRPPHWGRGIERHLGPASEYDMGVKEREEFKALKREWESIIPF